MKKLVLILIILIMPIISFGSEFQKIAEIQLSPEIMKQMPDPTSIIFKSAKKKELSREHCFSLFDLIQTHIKDIPKEKWQSIFLVAENEMGERMSISFREIDPITTINEAYIIVEKVTGEVGDTVTVWDNEDELTKIDMKLIEKEFQSKIETNVYLQIKKISKKDKDILFKPFTIIFTQDKNYYNWMIKVKKIELYIIQN